MIELLIIFRLLLSLIVTIVEGFTLQFDNLFITITVKMNFLIRASKNIVYGHKARRYTLKLIFLIYGITITSIELFMALKIECPLLDKCFEVTCNDDANDRNNQL